MDFKWAVNQMKEGKKVRRDAWGSNYYWVLIEDTIKNTPGHTPDEPGTNWITNLESTDWELYEEEIYLNDIAKKKIQETKKEIKDYIEDDVCFDSYFEYGERDLLKKIDETFLKKFGGKIEWLKKKRKLRKRVWRI